MSEERPLAEFVSSFIEYKVTFEAPVFTAFEQPTTIAEALHTAFHEWNPAFENLTFRSLPTSANDLQVGCDLFNKRVTFTISPGSGTLLMLNPNWAEAQLVQKLAASGVYAAGRIGAKPKEQTVTLTMHVKAPGKSAKDLTARFRPDIKGPEMDREVRGFGFCVYGQEALWVVDLSALYADAVFIRAARSFDASISFEQIAALLYKDEVQIFDLLELRIE